MSRQFWVVLFLALLMLVRVADAQDLIINEVMASNATTLADEDGDFEDWIELYNAGNGTVNLSGYGLSDDYHQPFRWILPDVDIQAGGFLLIWASGKNRKDPAGPLHTNFRISRDGEEVLLTRPDGTMQDEMVPTFIPTDVSYGRKPDGADHWFYFEEPTPGESNATEGATHILDPPAFSFSSGFFDDSFHVEITHDDPGTTILYTLDGSTPRPENLGGATYQYVDQYPENPGDEVADPITRSYHTHVFDDPILVEDLSNEPDRLTMIPTTWHAQPGYVPDDPVFKGTIVRAIAVKEGALASNEVFETYFVSSSGHHDYSLPVVSVATSESYLFDYENGIYVPGIDFLNWREDNPASEADWRVPSNYHRRGVEWEYPAAVMLFDKDREVVFQQNTGFRIHGGWARTLPAKSLRLYARNLYGNDVIDAEIFSGHGRQPYKRLLLRNSGQDWPRTLFRDAALQTIFEDLNFDTQAYQPTLLFINSEYWGIFNIRERYDKHYLERVYGVDGENLDIIANHREVKEGDDQHYLSLMGYVEDHDLSESAHYAHVKTKMDINNFIDYHIAQIFSGNNDWPHSNMDFWRLRTDEFIEQAQPGHDGRWRWLMYDLDVGFGVWVNEDFNAIEWATDPEKEEATLLFRKLLENQAFKHAFINRFADLLNTSFLPSHTKQIIRGIKTRIKPEINEHIGRWSQHDDKDEWLGRVDRMLEYAERRPGFQKDHMMSYFGLPGTHDFTLDVCNVFKGKIRINSMVIDHDTPGTSGYPYPWKGAYFEEVPVRLEARPAPGYVFSHWEGDIESTDAAIEITPEDDLELKAHFQRLDIPVVIHYWYFDTRLPNNTPLEQLDAFYSVADVGRINYESSLAGYPYDEGHPLWRKASMERRNMPTILNYLPELNDDIPYVETEMRGLQVRQPFVADDRENTLVFDLPTTGFKDILFRFAARDEGAADHLEVDFRLNDESEWTAAGLESSELDLSHAYQLFEVDLRDVPGAANNEDFQLRLRFAGPDMAADEGERVTFNNISLQGTPVGAHVITAAADQHGQIEPSGRIPVYAGDSYTFQVTPDDGYRIVAIYLDGACMVDELSCVADGHGLLTVTNVTEDHYLNVSFSLDENALEKHEDRVALYPNPATHEVRIASLEPMHRVDLLNQHGQLVWSQRNIGGYHLQVDLGGFRNGLYVVRIETDAGVVIKKLQVMR